SPPPKDPAKVELVKGARQKLDELEALIAAHRLSDAWAAAPQVRDEAEKAGWSLLSAEAAFAQGDVLVALQDAAAEAPLLESARLATASRDDRLAARAYLTLAGHLASTKQNAEKAMLLADVADGLVSRVDDGGEIKVQLLRSRGSALMTQGKYD